ncbi:MAG: hypothetical protein ACRDVE_02105 [Actinocrinis sp.]
MLVRGIGALSGADMDDALFAQRICETAARWPGYLGRYVRRREKAGRPIAWYEEPKLEQGAYATVLGVSLRRASGPVYSGGGVWTAAALGDSCAFQVRGERLVAAFPLASPEDFDTSPDLAGTRNPDRDLIERRTLTRRGTWLPGDVFYLATDAASQWFLAQDAVDGRPWRQIDAAFDDQTAWLDELRARRLIRNDDVTIVRCRLDRVDAGRAAAEADAQPEPGAEPELDAEPGPEADGGGTSEAP